MDTTKHQSYYQNYIKLNIYRFLIKTLIIIIAIILTGLVLNAIIFAFMQVFLENLPNYCNLINYVPTI